MPFVALVLVASEIAGFPAVEAVETRKHGLAFVTNASTPDTETDLVVMERSPDPVPPEFLGMHSGIQFKGGGPATWGVQGDAYYCVSLSFAFNGSMMSVAHLIADRLAVERALKDRRGNPEARARLDGYSGQHGRFMDFFIGHLSSLSIETNFRRSNWDIYYDLAYTAQNHVMFIAVRRGELHWWTFNKPEDTDWVDRGTMRVDMAEGAFRIVQGGGDLYLVDKEGRVYSSPERGAKMLGQIAGWGEPREGEQLILLEEQNADKIAVVRVMGEDITPLRFNGDAGAMDDFLEEITDEALRAALVRMAEILEDDEREGGGG